MQTAWIRIDFIGAHSARVAKPRIEGIVAKADDRVLIDGWRLHVETDDPGSFLKNFYDEGFEEKIVCEPLR